MRSAFGEIIFIPSPDLSLRERDLFASFCAKPLPGEAQVR
jgi:hypothetical protein